MVYTWSIVRRPSAYVFFKDLRNYWSIIANFYMEPPWVHVAETKVCSKHLGHMTKMAITPVYGKTLRNLLFRNDTWYAESDTPVHHKLFKDDPGSTFT